jgi:hypothetical protein
MPGSYDVDEVADLTTAYRALAADPRPARLRLRDLLVSMLGTPQLRELATAAGKEPLR